MSKYIVTMTSELYGVASFPRDTRRAVRDTLRNLKQNAKALNDGVERTYAVERVAVAAAPRQSRKSLSIKRFNCTTPKGNTISFFYSPKNNLVVVDVIDKNERGGTEILRQTLNERRLLAHAQ